MFASRLKLKLLVKHIFQHISAVMFSYGNPFSPKSTLTYICGFRNE